MTRSDRAPLTRARDFPNPACAIASYRARASSYDAWARRTMRLRARTLSKLALMNGERVLDVGSGTGLSFAFLARAVGAGGAVVGIELSPDMARLSAARIARAGWNNVSLVVGAAEEASLPGVFDAVLFNFTHDVLQSPRALANIFAGARDGARVAIAGSRLYPRWLAPLNAFVRWNNAPYMTTFAGLERPWAHIERFVPKLAIESALCGAGYVASGIYRRQPRAEVSAVIG